MQKEKFYNRIHETQHLVEIINSAKPNNKIIVLAGPTGIGKSTLINKVPSYELSNHSSIHVSICKRNPDTIENLYYFNAFYRTLVNSITNRKRNSLHFDPSVLKNFVAMSVDIFLDKTIGEGHTLYVPYKIGKLQIQGFSEPITAKKIKQSYHITQKAARSRPRAAFLRGKLGRRQKFSKK